MSSFIMSIEHTYYHNDDKPLASELLAILKDYDGLMIKNPLFNYPLDNIPENIIGIVIHSSLFNQKIDNLHKNIEYIDINSHEFNQPIDNLPLRLKEINITGKFNQNIDNLPLELEKLDLGYYFNQNIDNLPISLKRLVLGECFNQELRHLPSNLTYFLLDNHNYLHSLDFLPDSIQTIYLYCLPMNIYTSCFNITKLPANISKIVVTTQYHFTNIRDLVEAHNMKNPDKKCIYHIIAP